MITLLDVNVLIALVDEEHVHHHQAKRFFLTIQSHGWATCPMTENGFLRIVGRPGADHGPDSPSVARTLLSRLSVDPGHVFWPDDLSLANTGFFPALPASRHLTDLYLLGLAVKNGGRLATFDAGIDASLLPNGPSAYLIIPSP